MNEHKKFGKLLKRLLIVCLCLVMALGSAATIFADGFNGDLNNDGAITSFDAQMLAEYEAGLRELSWTEEVGLTVRGIIDTILGRTANEPDLDEGIEAVIEVNAENGIVTKDKTVSAAGVTATVPAGTKVTGKTLKLSVKKTNSTEGDVALEENQEQLALDIHVDGVAADNTTPIVITVENALEGGYNQGNLELYHVENSVANEMEQVNAAETLNEHNSFYYDPATGDFTVAMATFSVVRILTDNTKVWNGTVVDTWYRESETSFEIFNADQLAGLGKLVDEGKTFEGKIVTLCMDVVLSDGTHKDETTSFNPIGYGYNYQDSGKAFKGTFDGNGNTIYNLYQNGWDLGYSYSTAGGGLFASAYDATIKNLTMDNAYIVMECIDMGTVVGYAQGDCVFENIVVRNSTLANYQRYTGGAIGEVSNGHHILKNVDVEASTTVGSLWGDFDNASGGLIGGKWGHNYDNEREGKDGHKVSVKMVDCDVAATLDVYNDVTSAYQWYSYRRCGMLIGMSEENTTINGRTQATATYLKTENCTVTYTGWEDYHYCEFGDTTSLEARYPWVRVEAGNFCGAYSNVRYGVPTFESKELDVTPSHIDNKDCHNDKDGHYELIKFNQLYGGGQGCYGGNGHVGNGVTVYDADGKKETTTKFESTGVKLIQTGDTVKLGELFKAADNATIQGAYVYAFVSPANEESTVGITTVAPTASGEWEKMEIKFSGEGAAKIVITDYNYCQETVLYVTVAELGWVLVTDASELTAGDKIVVTSVKEDEKAPGYYALSTAQGNNNRGAVSITKNNDEIIINDDVQILTLETGLGAGTWAFNTGDGYLYAAASGSNHLKTEAKITVNGSWKVVVTDGVASIVAESSSYRNVMRYNPNNGTPLFSCYESASSVKDIAIYKQSIVCAHKGAEVISETAPTCTDAGSRTLNCPTCGTITEVIPALGHEYKSVVTDPTCTADGYTTHTCSVCQNTYQDSKTSKTEHDYENGACKACGALEPVEVWELVTDANEIYAGGQFILVANDQWALPTTISSKMNGVKVTVSNNQVEYEEGTTPVWTIEKGTSNFALSNGTAYLKYSSNTNLGSSNSTYAWSLTVIGDAFKVVSSTDSTRGLVFRTSTYNQFGGYALSNVTTTSNEYFGIKFYKLTGGAGDVETPCEHANTTTATVDATCTTAGSTTVTCKDCGETVSTTPIVALGHETVEKVTQAATCTAAGSKTITCSRCDYEKTEEIAALGHNYVGGVCSNCGETESGTTDPVETTATLSFADKAQRTSFSTSEQVWEQNGIVVTNDRNGAQSPVADYANPARFYKGSKLTVEASGNITQIVFDCNSSSYATALKTSMGTLSGATVDVSSDKVTVTFAEGVESFVIAKLSDQVRMDAVTVTYQN